MILSFDRFDKIKANSFVQCADIKPTHRAEILASGFGYKTYAALRADLKNGDVDVHFDFTKAAQRAAALGIPNLPDNFFSQKAEG